MIKMQINTAAKPKGAWHEEEREFDAALAALASQARTRGRPELVTLQPRKGYSLSLVVGADDTFLVYGGRGRKPVYCHSRAATEAVEPYFASFQGEAEVSTPRRLIIPMKQGMRAVKEFITHGERPACITWEDMVD